MVEPVRLSSVNRPHRTRRADGKDTVRHRQGPRRARTAGSTVAAAPRSGRHRLPPPANRRPRRRAEAAWTGAARFTPNPEARAAPSHRRLRGRARGHALRRDAHPASAADARQQLASHRHHLAAARLRQDHDGAEPGLQPGAPARNAHRPGRDRPASPCDRPDAGAAGQQRFASVLEGTCPLRQHALRYGPNLAIATSHAAVRNPAELLHSPTVGDGARPDRGAVRARRS